MGWYVAGKLNADPHAAPASTRRISIRTASKDDHGLAKLVGARRKTQRAGTEQKRAMRAADPAEPAAPAKVDEEGAAKVSSPPEPAPGAAEAPPPAAAAAAGQEAQAPAEEKVEAAGDEKTQAADIEEILLDGGGGGDAGQPAAEDKSAGSTA